MNALERLSRVFKRSWRLAGALVQLRAEIGRAYPGRSIVSDGSIGDASHSARESDHNPDAAGVVRAIDVTQWDPATPTIPGDDVAEALAEFLRASKDSRIKYVIWRGRMFSSYATRTCKAWEWRPYTGPNGHFHHVHISVQPGALGDDARTWGFTRPGGAKPDPNKGRKWHQIVKGANDTGLYAKGYRNDIVAELQILLGHPVTGTYNDIDAGDIVKLKRQAHWPTKPGEAPSLVDDQLIAAIRTLAKVA